MTLASFFIRLWLTSLPGLLSLYVASTLGTKNPNKLHVGSMFTVITITETYVPQPFHLECEVVHKTSSRGIFRVELLSPFSLLRGDKLSTVLANRLISFEWPHGEHPTTFPFHFFHLQYYETSEPCIHFHLCHNNNTWSPSSDFDCNFARNSSSFSSVVTVAKCSANNTLLDLEWYHLY